jgi:hypothetical protein
MRYGYGQQDSIFVKKIPVSGSINASFGKVQYWEPNQQEYVTDINYSLALSAGLYLGNNYSLALIFNLPLNEKVTKNMPWIADYSYMVVRSKYAPNTFYWGYSNFGYNKYSNSLKQFGHSFVSGNFLVGYFIRIPDSVMKFLKIFPSSKLAPSIQINYAPRYYNERGEFVNDYFGKPVLCLNLKYILFKNIFVNGSVSYYLRKNIKLPWDSDYTYGFGFENWRPWKMSITYSNYTNHFPGEPQTLNSGFLYGSLSLSFNYAFNYKKYIKKQNIK